MKVKLYIQASKYSFQDEFSVSVSCYKSTSDARNVIIDIDELEIDVDVPEFTQEQFTSGHVEQLRIIKEKLKADTHLKIKSLDEQIESLLAIECK
jgi:hypothetical protein